MPPVQKGPVAATSWAPPATSGDTLKQIRPANVCVQKSL